MVDGSVKGNYRPKFGMEKRNLSTIFFLLFYTKSYFICTRIAETDAQISKRIEKWDKFLVEGEDEPGKEKKMSEVDKEKVSMEDVASSTKRTEEAREEDTTKEIPESEAEHKKL